MQPRSCFACPIGCSRDTKTVRHGIEFVTEGPDYETIYAFGSNCDINDPEVIIAADRLCDEYGIDTISCGVSVGFAMECFERGLISKEDTGGIDLTFGNGDALLDVIHLIAKKEGIGERLSEGVKRASEKIGGTSGFAIHVKGLELPGYDVRGAKAHGLSYATAYTGADHNRGYAFQEIFGIPIPSAVDRFATEGKGELTKWNQDMRTATADCPTMCVFLLDMAVPSIAAQNTAALMEAITDLSYTPEDVQKVGERINNLARAFNVREGFTRSDDTLPDRLMTEPLQSGASKGQVISKEDLKLMLDEYYTVRGWDVDTGTPTREKLAELGLEYVADQIAKM